ncbi:hypothetical protein [uncultured Phenylobacterium sp.]|uniref:hypothetical protein n=1 Tax=uncultured Phenylobacterium sp. TaxID=349273 RepID=UPI00345DD616
MEALQLGEHRRAHLVRQDARGDGGRFVQLGLHLELVVLEEAGDRRAGGQVAQGLGGDRAGVHLAAGEQVLAAIAAVHAFDGIAHLSLDVLDQGVDATRGDGLAHDLTDLLGGVGHAQDSGVLGGELVGDRLGLLGIDAEAGLHRLHRGEDLGVLGIVLQVVAVALGRDLVAGLHLAPLRDQEVGEDRRVVSGSGDAGDHVRRPQTMLSRVSNRSAAAWIMRADALNACW